MPDLTLIVMGLLTVGSLLFTIIRELTNIRKTTHERLAAAEAALHEANRNRNLELDRIEAGIYAIPGASLLAPTGGKMAQGFIDLFMQAFQLGLVIKPDAIDPTALNVLRELRLMAGTVTDGEINELPEAATKKTGVVG